MTVSRRTYFSSSNDGDNTRWIEFDSLKTLQCTVSNIYCEITKSSMPVTFALNLPLRVWSCITGVRDKRYVRVAYDILALYFLVFYGRYVAISVDIVSELIHLYPKIFKVDREVSALLGISRNAFPEEDNSLDFSIYENALRYLGLSTEEAQNREILEICYNRLSEVNQRDIKRLQDLGHSGHLYLVKKIEGFLRDVNVAYQTAQAALEENSSEESNYLDISIYENAIRYLGLLEEQAQNREMLETRYNQISEVFQTQIGGRNSSESILSRNVGGLLRNLNIAYKTVQTALEESSSEKNNFLDVSIYENALRYLGLSAKQAQNREILDARYSQMSEAYQTWIERLNSSRPGLSRNGEEFLRDLNVAYQTVLEGGTMSAYIGRLITAIADRVTSLLRTSQTTQAVLEESKEKER